MGVGTAARRRAGLTPTPAGVATATAANTPVARAADRRGIVMTGPDQPSKPGLARPDLIWHSSARIDWLPVQRWGGAVGQPVSLKP